MRLLRGRIGWSQRDHESFSETTKRVIPTPLDIEAYRRRLEKLSLSEKAAEAIEEQVRRRHKPSLTGGSSVRKLD